MESTIHNNCFGSLVQNDKMGKYILTCQGNHFSFTPKEFRSFSKKIASINLEKLLLDSNEEHEIICLPEYDFVLVLTIIELIKLKDLVHTSKLMLELNSLLVETI
ncbi:MAG: hypothetical protein AB8B61_10325 [Cyclobacteriaceae bacterium]